MSVMTMIFYNLRKFVDEIDKIEIGNLLGLNLSFSLYDMFFSFVATIAALNLMGFWGFEGDWDDTDATLSDSEEFDGEDE